MILLLSLVACKPGADTAVDTLAFCPGATAQLWAPSSGDELLQFPDDSLTVADDTSPTGLRLDLRTDETPWLLELPELLRSVGRGLQRRSGFGRLGGVLLRFSGDIGAVPDPSALRLVDVSVSPPEDVPYTATLSGDGRQLILQPLRPMRPGARHAAVLSRDHAAADGDCVAPAPALQAVLSGTSDLDARIVERYEALPELLGMDAEDISSATVFTTHDDLTLVREIADAAQERTGTWTVSPVCEAWTHGRKCTGRFLSQDHRGEEDIVLAEPSSALELDVDLYLPPAGEPAPLLIYGHGINGRRGHVSGAADRLTPELGVALVAVDALEHGSHPEADPNTMDAMAFLGMSLSPPQLDGLALAQNFVQSNLDRLQLLALLQQQPDLDGDGLDDIDPEQVGYIGVSLGGMMGTGVLALSDDVDAGVLAVAGGHLTTFAIENEFVIGLQGVFEELVGGPDAWARALLVAQAAIDPADPAVYAAHIFDERLGAVEDGPDVLVPVSVFDTIVPVTAGEFLARALGAPHVEPIVSPIEGVEAGAAPLSSGFFQLDRVTSGDGAVASDHANTPWSAEGTLMATRFFAGWLDDGAAEIVDPYDALGTPPLE